MANQYGFDERATIGEQANREVIQYLKSLKNTISVIDLQDDAHFQKRDIDLLYVFKTQSGYRTMTIEVKGDTQHKTGNYFIETVSNENEGSDGCFLYSEADYFFYYFVGTKDLHIIPLEDARTWFITRMTEFEPKKVFTIVNGGGYQSEGRLVPIKRMNKEVGVTTRNIGRYVTDGQMKLEV